MKILLSLFKGKNLNKTKKINAIPVTISESPAANIELVKLVNEGKCFLIMEEECYGCEFNLNKFFAGHLNDLYKDDFYINRDHFIYSNLALALKHSTHRGTSNIKSVYIMVAGYTESEVKTFSKQGKFHETIVRAINAKQLYLEISANLNALNTEKIAKVEIISNPEFNPELKNINNCKSFN